MVEGRTYDLNLLALLGTGVEFVNDMPELQGVGELLRDFARVIDDPMDLVRARIVYTAVGE